MLLIRPFRFMLRMLRLFALLLVFAVAGIFAFYRLPVDDTRIIEGEVFYRMIDLGSGDGFRWWVFEPVMGNRRVHLTDGRVFYIGKEDHRRIWEETPFAMMEKGYTKYAVLEVSPVSAGYGVARLKELRRQPGSVSTTK